MWMVGGFNMYYIGIILISLVLGIATQSYIKSTYNKWSKVPLGVHKTGAEVAREMLQFNGVHDVEFYSTGGGELDDHYDPRDNTLHLSEANMEGGSVASAAVACHEAGHACQHAQHYAPEAIRVAVVPVVNLASNFWMVLLIMGIFMNVTGLIHIGIILFAAVVVFQLITLPVEFNASKRAVRYLSEAGYDETTVQGSKAVLTAAALTYVAAALVSCLQLLYLLGQTNRR